MDRSHTTELLPGTIVAKRFEIQNCLGVGKGAAVYQCTNLDLPSHPLAIKVFFPQACEYRRAPDRFRREISCAYEVNHPNVVRIYDFIQESDLIAYTMEYVSGGSLAELIEDEHQLEISEFVSLAGQLAAGVQAIHNAGIIHRDLKPENILITEQRKIKIADFGIAHVGGNRGRLTEHGNVLGTFTYVSPEYLTTGEIDQRSDVYSLGVLLHELLTGESPHPGETVAEMMRARVSGEPTVARITRKDCPEELRQIVRKSLADSPESRYQSAAELHHDLRELFPWIIQRDGAVENATVQQIKPRNFAKDTTREVDQRRTLTRTPEPPKQNYQIFAETFDYKDAAIPAQSTPDIEVMRPPEHSKVRTLLIAILIVLCLVPIGSSNLEETVDFSEIFSSSLKQFEEARRSYQVELSTAKAELSPQKKKKPAQVRPSIYNNGFIRPIFGSEAVQMCSERCTTLMKKPQEVCERACGRFSLREYGRRINARGLNPTLDAKRIINRCMLRPISEDRYERRSKWLKKVQSLYNILYSAPRNNRLQDISSSRHLFNELYSATNGMKLPLQDNELDRELSKNLMRVSCLRANLTLVEIGVLLTRNGVDALSESYWSGIHDGLYKAVVASEEEVLHTIMASGVLPEDEGRA